MTDIRKGFIKDSEGVYRRGRFYIKDGKILRESKLVPAGTVEEVKDTYVTAQEAIRSVLAYSTTIGAPVRTTDVFINKVGNTFKPSDSYSSTDTVAVVTSSNNVLTVRVADVTPQYDESLRLTDKADLPQDPKETKEFISNAKDKEFDNIEEVTKKELSESENINESDADGVFLNDLKDLINKHTREEIKDIRFKELTRTDFVLIEYPNGTTVEVNITADSNLQAIEDIVKELLKHA